MDADTLIKGAAPQVVADPEAARAILRSCLLDHPEILFAYVFGSFAEGLPCRDIDVGVFVDAAKLNGLDSFDFETRLSLELSRAAGLPVDLRVINSAPVGFQHSVLQGEVLVVRDEARLGDFIEFVSAEYMDFAWLGREFLREVLAACGDGGGSVSVIDS
jgi:predicted nucleotidyltransferase